MRVRLNGPFADLELCSRAQLSRADPADLQLRDEHEVLAQLRAVMQLRAAGQLRPAPRGLRALLFDLGEDPQTHDDDQLLTHVARLVALGALELRVLPHELLASDPVEIFEDLSERSMAPVPAPIVEADHWIEYALQREDGTPLAGVRCEITLPWGVTVIRTSDPLGIIRLDHLPDTGDTLIHLPLLDEEPPPEPVEEDDWELVDTYVEDETVEGKDTPHEDETPNTPQKDRPGGGWALVTYNSEHEQPELRPGTIETKPEEPDELPTSGGGDDFVLVSVDTVDYEPVVTPAPTHGGSGGSSSGGDTQKWGLVSTKSEHEQPELTPKSGS